MKKLISLLTVLSLIIGFTACSSDKPDDLPVSMNASASQSFTLIAAAGSTQNPDVTLELGDFTSISQYVKYIEKADVLATSYFEFTGIPTSEDVKLSNVSLSLASNSKTKISLPDITTDQKITTDTASNLNFLQAVMNEINRKGSSKLILNYTTATNLTDPSTKLKIQMNVRFSFN